MTNKNLKSKLHLLIDQIEDITLLKKIYAILESVQKKSIVTEPFILYQTKGKLAASGKKPETNYTKPGKPMSVQAFKNMIKKAEQSKSYSHKDFLEEVELWG